MPSLRDVSSIGIVTPTIPQAGAHAKHGTHKALLLMRETPAQVFCANALFHDGVIDGVYIEAGSTGEPDRWAMASRLWRYGPRGIWQRVIRDLRVFDHQPTRVLKYYLMRLRTHGLVGRQRWHEARLLGPSCRCLGPGLRIVRGPSVNDVQCRQLIQHHHYRLVFVFGTGLLREELLQGAQATFINLHHGWLPRFRGEGVIAALAEEGPNGLGVTVHVVDRGVDTGPILYRERLAVEPGDNAYALALKATLRGVSLFRQVYQDAQHGPLHGMPQEPGAGRLYTAQMLKRSYQMRLAAAKSLRAVDAQGTHLSGAKQLAAQAAVASGLTVLSRKRHGRRLRMLMYHGVLPQVIGPATFGNLFLDLEIFARHLRYLARHFTVLSCEEILACQRAGRPFPERALAITFDDGYRSLLTHVLPLARQYRLPITAFVLAGDIADGVSLWVDVLRVLVADASRTQHTIRVAEELVIDGRLMRDPEATFVALSRRILALPAERAERLMVGLRIAGQTAHVLERYPEFCLAGWDEWRQALASGMVSVGSHGLTHRNLTHLSREEQRSEAQESKLLIERELGGLCRALAYPYGAWDETVADAVRAAGYLCAVTTDEGLNTIKRNPFQLRRTMIGDKGYFAMFCARVSGAWDRVRSRRA